MRIVFSWPDSDPFSRTGAPNCPIKTLNADIGFPSQNGIIAKRRNMFRRKQDPAQAVKSEMSQRAGNPASEPELACWIQKQENFFADPIALLAAVPQSHPLMEREIPASDRSSDSAIHMKSNGNSRDGIFRGDW